MCPGDAPGRHRLPTRSMAPARSARIVCVHAVDLSLSATCTEAMCRRRAIYVRYRKRGDSDVSRKRRALILLAALAPALLLSVILPQSQASASACWTSFNPPAPQGGQMTQIYYNCSNSTAHVQPYYSWHNALYVYNNCVVLGPWETAVWYYSRTIADAVYSTANCAPQPDITNEGVWTVDSSSPCYTRFDPPAPNGAAMSQFYGNCFSIGVSVTPAYWLNGNLWFFWRDCQSPGGRTSTTIPTAFWYFPSTVPGAQYTTAYCLGTSPG
jgi:hypothetical protein